MTRITPRQLTTVLFLTLFPLGTERLAALLAPCGPAAWLCPLAAGAVVVLLTLLLTRHGLGHPLSALPPRAQKPAAALFLLWALLLTAAHAARVGDRLAVTLTTSPVLFSALLLALAAWLAAGGLPALARACDLFAVAVGGGFFLIALFGVFDLNWPQVLLMTPRELSQVPLGAVSVLGTLAVGACALLLYNEVEPEQGTGALLARRLAKLFLLLAAALVLILGRLGPDLAGQIRRPFFQMVSGLGFAGAIQRLEELASALWLLGDAALLALLLLVLTRLTARLAGSAPRWSPWLLAAAAFLLSLPAQLWDRLLTSPWPTALSLAMGAFLVLLSALSGKRAKKNEKS